MLESYSDILARVRGDSNFHSIKQLVQPWDEAVMDLAAILKQNPDFVAACQDFVNNFTSYRREIGDYWATPEETMAPVCPNCLSIDIYPLDPLEEIYHCNYCGWEGTPIQVGDCDDKAILLVSLLRTEFQPGQVACAFGDHILNGKKEGHMWVVMQDGGIEDRIIEATASSKDPLRGEYNLMALFNDKIAFAYPEAIREFALKVVKEEEYVTA